MAYLTDLEIAQKCEMRGLEPTAENMAKFTEYSK